MSGSDSGAARGGGNAAPLVQANNFALQNGTPNIVALNTPNDGNTHSYFVSAALNVTGAETGGLVRLNYTATGHLAVVTVFVANEAVGFFQFGTVIAADPNTSVTILQASALTAGAANINAAISGG